MKRVLLLILFLVALGCARPLLVLAQEPCVQPFYSIPEWVDVNEVTGIALPALVVNGEAIWSVRVGYMRRVAIACDPDGDPLTVKCLSPGWEVTIEGNNWVLVGTVRSGIEYVRVEVSDGIDAVPYTVCIGSINNAPILY